MTDYHFSIYQVFGDSKAKLKGNTAAVVELDLPISSGLMQNIARDFNQPATSFIWKDKEKWSVRWYAPDGEIGLCGHGSLAAVAYLADRQNLEEPSLNYPGGQIRGKSINPNYCSISMDAISTQNHSEPEKALRDGLGIKIKAHYKTDNKNLVVVENEDSVKNMSPNFQILKMCSDFGFVVTAPGSQTDFVSRTLVPHVQQLEDPATGSSHAILAPFWSKILNKTKMAGLQMSKRGGKFICQLNNSRVILQGEQKILVRGKLYI